MNVAAPIDSPPLRIAQDGAVPRVAMCCSYILSHWYPRATVPTCQLSIRRACGDPVLVWSRVFALPRLTAVQCVLSRLGVCSRSLVRPAGLRGSWLCCTGHARLTSRHAHCPSQSQPRPAGPAPPPPAVCLGSPPTCERATFTLTQQVSPWLLRSHVPSNRSIAPPSGASIWRTRASASFAEPEPYPPPISHKSGEHE